jgi:SAM-dependent methyltransferase
MVNAENKSAQRLKTALFAALTVGWVGAAEARRPPLSEGRPSCSRIVRVVMRSTFGDGEFDLVTGFNSFQYAGNPVVALREGTRVAKPNGRIVIVTWGEPKGMPAVSVITALKPLMPPSPPGAPGPFALSDETALRQYATNAGLTPLDVFDVDNPFLFPNESAALRGWSSSGVAVRVSEISSDSAVNDAHAKAVAPFRRPDGSYYIGASFRCLLAGA